MEFVAAVDLAQPQNGELPVSIDEGSPDAPTSRSMRQSPAQMASHLTRPAIRPGKVPLLEPLVHPTICAHQLASRSTGGLRRCIALSVGEPRLRSGVLIRHSADRRNLDRSE